MGRDQDRRRGRGAHRQGRDRPGHHLRPGADRGGRAGRRLRPHPHDPGRYRPQPERGRYRRQPVDHGRRRRAAAGLRRGTRCLPAGRGATAQRRRRRAVRARWHRPPQGEQRERDLLGAECRGRSLQGRRWPRGAEACRSADAGRQAAAAARPAGQGGGRRRLRARPRAAGHAARSRVVRPPSYRAVLQAFDGKRIETMPGVRAVVRDGRFLGVVAAARGAGRRRGGGAGEGRRLAGSRGPAGRRCHCPPSCDPGHRRRRC